VYFAYAAEILKLQPPHITTSPTNRSGWDVVRIYEDAGISGAKGRDKRPGLDTMMRAVNAKRFVLERPKPDL
jgi:DNA invertase Pin-like site-specific DNA recombinase